MQERDGAKPSAMAEEAVSRHYKDIFRFVYRLLAGDRQTAEDITQEAFLRLAQSNGQLLEGGVRVRRWLFVVARNLCMSYFRKQARRPSVLLESIPSPATGGSRTAEKNERDARIAAAIGALPPDMREVVVLREFEGMSYAEIALTAGCSEGTVKSRLARARGRLREQLARQLEYER